VIRTARRSGPFSFKASPRLWVTSERVRSAPSGSAISVAFWYQRIASSQSPLASDGPALAPDERAAFLSGSVFINGGNLTDS